MFQNNSELSKNSLQTIYISTNLETVHKILLNDADFDYLNKSANSITVYWFVDCIYRGNTTSYTFLSNYTQPDTQHEILGIVVATTGSPNNTITTTSTSTTVAAPTISTTTGAVTDFNTTTTSTITTTPIAPFTTDAISSHQIINSTYTSECQQKKPVDLLLSAVLLENQQKYGYFSHSILVKGI